jgi:O-antigen/teichoic acid export membrane protein
MIFFQKFTRTGRFFRTLVTSLAHLGAATLYTFFLIPLILRYENPEKLGLWLLVSQVGIYLLMVDAGLSALSIRQFVGLVSTNDFTKLAPRFQATWLISAIQGLIVISVGFTGSWFATLFQISGDLRDLFCHLFLAQCILVGIGFPIRPFNSILLAKQVYDHNYLANSLAFLVSFGLTWVGFHSGWGLWSILAGNCFQLLMGAGVSWVGVAQLTKPTKLFSSREEWLALIPQIFRESTSFASGSLFATFGGLVQSAFLSRLFGLEGVAAWNVGAKIATALSQVMSKFFESSFAGLSELAEQGRRDSATDRFLKILSYAATGTVVLACLILLGNGLFVEWWTKGQIHWPPSATNAVAFWLVAITLNRAFAVFAGVLLIWPCIRLAPVFDFISLVLALSLAYFARDFTLFVWCWAVSPLLAGMWIYVWGLSSAQIGLRDLLCRRFAWVFWLALGFFFFLMILPSSRS